ncbi:MAG: zinc dependent phospholipase C family protein [Eubacteriales bacterium]|nr:zinc dependent phospholipase C family protein [Eubacteriales bacterium]
MRKKSHILVARYLADQMPGAVSLQMHRKAFCLGSILPDIQPSFVTKRHEFSTTFEEVQEKIRRLTADMNAFRISKDRVYWRRLGEIIHYIADYFTFPHNAHYTGTLLEHTHYEKELKDRLKACINSGDAAIYTRTALDFNSAKELIDFIRKSHELYVKKARNVLEDIDFILTVCYQTVQGMFRLIQKCCGYTYAMNGN